MSTLYVYLGATREADAARLHASNWARSARKAATPHSGLAAKLMSWQT
jgi:hypothetical protein